MKKLTKFVIVMVTLFSIEMIAQSKEVTIETVKITDQIYMLKGRGGNIGLFVGEDAVLMIDDQFAPLTPKILKAIKTITTKNVDYLINTHWHGDHTGGNQNMAKEGALIFAQNNVRERLSKESVRRGEKVPPAPKDALPIVTFGSDMNLHINNETVLATHIHNAHTDGDALIYFMNNNVLHTGDSYFHKKFPYIDLSSGGSVQGYIEGLNKMIRLIDDETQIIPGHGSVSNKKELQAYIIMLTTITKNIQDEMSKGKSLDEVKKNSDLIKGFENYEGWITGERIRETIYKSLQQN